MPGTVALFMPLYLCLYSSVPVAAVLTLTGDSDTVMLLILCVVFSVLHVMSSDLHGELK